MIVSVGSIQVIENPYFEHLINATIIVVIALKTKRLNEFLETLPGGLST